mmetsp:Transcript_30578/g.74490  ORF Transcript_30578/g.74490 Transcript_30578/m.74490 type:complete len:210 (-) Transcript_30578:1221-1850(-)
MLGVPKAAANSFPVMAHIASVPPLHERFAVDLLRHCTRSASSVSGVPCASQQRRRTPRTTCSSCCCCCWLWQTWRLPPRPVPWQHQGPMSIPRRCSALAGNTPQRSSTPASCRRCPGSRPCCRCPPGCCTAARRPVRERERERSRRRPQAAARSGRGAVPAAAAAGPTGRSGLASVGRGWTASTARGRRGCGGREGPGRPRGPGRGSRR